MLTLGIAAPAPAHGQGALVAAVGDIACASLDLPTPSRCQQAAVARAVERSGARSVWLAGDIQYPDGALSDFSGSFGKSWRKLRPLMRPTPGNHEYNTPGAAGYFDYFGKDAGPARRGYYSFNVGRWHVVSLNSNCELVGCGADSAQARWLRADLARNRRICSAAIWHHPLFSSGAVHGGEPATAPLWRVLAAHRAELVVSGHDHDFEVFKRQSARARADRRRGIQQFVVGTGGTSMYGFGAKRPNSLVQLTGVFGFLALRLRAKSYSWRFLDTHRRALASGRARCH